MPSEDLIYEVRDSIGHVIFNRPAARNAFTIDMYTSLAEICAQAPTDGSVKAIIMTGAGDKAFGSGTDMTQFRGFATSQDAWGYEDKMEGVLSRIERCPVPTIAAINGACTGGGAAIAACCDIRLTTANLKFGFPIARTLGNCLSVNNLRRLSDLLGKGRVHEIMLTARLIEAPEALAIGLVSEVVDTVDTLQVRAGLIAESIAANAPLTMRATKEGLRRIGEASSAIDDRDLIEMCYMSEDFKEGMEAFLSKRKPEWKGR
ncbi:MAG: enoyl-CoA hydratase/isomerase family protein [Alphaproteobacteria bacterium]|nr:enoyl-CoA hydratase/isomerase family protein [Alphaproteobacteria bacterium]